jgi:hypothetical protein
MAYLLLDVKQAIINSRGWGHFLLKSLPVPAPLVKPIVSLKLNTTIREEIQKHFFLRGKHCVHLNTVLKT